MTVEQLHRLGKSTFDFEFGPEPIMQTHSRYMLRYLKAVQKMKQIIEENNLTVMATIARYACAYEAIAKPDWWTKSKRLVFPCLHLCNKT